MKRGKGGAHRVERKAAVLVFGEDDTDRRALRELVRALCPDAPRIETRRSPLVLQRGREEAQRLKNAQDIVRQVRTDAVRFDVKLVVAHEDCDDVDPAWRMLSKQIEKPLAKAGYAVAAAAPCWEIEAWWFLWPDALLKVNSNWKRPRRKGTQTGLIRNAKEQLIRDLRPSRRKRVQDYRESDGPEVTRWVRELDIVNEREAQSESFEHFAERVRSALCSS